MASKTLNTPRAKNLVCTLHDESKTIQEILEIFSNQLSDLVNEKQDVLEFDNQPVQNSQNPVISGGIYSFVSDLVNDRTNRPNVWLTPGSNASYSFAPAGNTNYFVQSPNSLSSLTITAFPDYNAEVLIYLYTGTSGCTVTLPTGSHYINSLTLSASTYYVCSILNGVFISVPTLSV